MPYWINSSSNDLIKRLLIKGDKEMKLELEEATTAALKQIEDMKYSQELISKEIKDIIKLAIVFKGKEIKITQDNN